MKSFYFVGAILLSLSSVAAQLLTKAGVGNGNGKVLQLENWTDTKVTTLNGNGQHALPVSA